VSLPPPLPNPFDAVDDETLYQMQVSLTYGCLRSRGAVQKKHREFICSLGQILKAQADQRPSKKPNFPFPPAA
jgi:hypothetical protein